MATNDQIGSVLPPEVIAVLKSSETYLDALKNASTEAVRRYTGLGSYRATWETFLSGFDRFGNNPVPPNNEVVGLTFITRPKLCLATANVMQDRVMSILNTVDPYRLEFAQRAYLDSKWARDPTFSRLVKLSPFVNSESPFIIPLMNGLRGLNGHPDFYLDTATTDGGFFGEDQTIATGSDFNMRSYDLSLTFQDIQSGFLLSLILFWVRYIALVRMDRMVAYWEDIVARRLNYTCSIYRFVLDPSRNSITKWGKATGCFPKVTPFGAMLDIPDRENYIHATQQFTVQFQISGAVEYNDPIILKEFNMITDNWAGNMIEAAKSGERVEAPNTAFNNFTGIPYIDLAGGVNQLKFYAKPEELEDPTDTLIQKIMNSMDTLRSKIQT